MLLVEAPAYYACFQKNMTINKEVQVHFIENCFQY